MIIETLRAVLLDDAAILAAFGDRIYPTTLPDAPIYPAMVLTKITAPGQYDLQGDVGLEEARVQVDIYSEGGQSDLIGLRNLVRRRLSGFSGGDKARTSGSCAIDNVKCINDSDLPEMSTERAGPRLRRRMLEFQVWNTEV